MKNINDVARHSVDGYGRQDISYNDPDGEFVFYDDYKEVEQRAEAAESEVAKWKEKAINAHKESKIILAKLVGLERLLRNTEGGK